MKLLYSYLLISLLTVSVFAQPATDVVRSLNTYVDYANASAEEVNKVVRSVIDYYETLDRKNTAFARYTCPFQLDNYFIENVAAKKKGIRADLLTSVEKALTLLQNAEQKIDQLCKALDTYHKLEDYKTDQFGKARTIIADIIVAVAEYKTAQQSLENALEQSYQKITPSNLAAYNSTRGKMLKAILQEKQLLASWNFNLEKKIHTGWPFDKLKASISLTNDHVDIFSKEKPNLRYPASSTWGQFLEGLQDVRRVKENAVDGYNIDAHKSDEHSNSVYLDLINYTNGVLISFYNTFIQFSERDGYYGLKALNIVPGITIQKQKVDVALEGKPFADIPRTPIAIKPVTSPIPNNTFLALNTYVDLINETWRSTNYLQSVLFNLNSSVNSFKRLDSYENRAPMHFDFSGYKLPLSLHQQSIANSKALAPEIAKALNDQAQVLMNILEELNQLCAYAEVHIREKQYVNDRLSKLTGILKRQQKLFEIWDDRKEQLYNDVRTIYEAYAPTDPAGSWQISGSALDNLVMLDHAALFEAKRFYNGDSTVRIKTDKIESTLRDVIAKEFDNMKGIEKYGRYNGNCPYTPYEDIPQASRQLVEHFQKLKPPSGGSRYSHPYQNMVYLYNSVVEDFNKFSELSKTVPHLKNIMQPEMFMLAGPEPSQKTIVEQRQSPPTQTVPALTPNGEVTQTPLGNPEKILRDTVYIEKRDTVYIRETYSDLKSMEGFATNHLVLLLDVSASMDQPEKLPVLKVAVLQLLDMMREEDKISIISFSGEPRVLLKSTSFKNRERIEKAIRELTSSGKTDANAAIELAYEVADDNYIRGGNNRIVLATDGEFGVSDQTRERIGKFSSDDIFLTIFNFGKGMGSGKTLEALANIGKGNYQAVSKNNIDLSLIREVKARRKK